MNDDELSRLRPTAATLEREWPATERDALLRTLLEDERPVRFAARHRPLRRIAVPVAVGALAALIAGLLVVILPGKGGRGDGDEPQQPLGTPLPATSLVATREVGPHQFAYRAVTSYGLHKGRLRVAATSETWAAADGTIWSYGTGDSGKKQCSKFPLSGDPRLQSPTKSFFDAMPTDTADLLTYLRKHVDGSSSREEAVFVAVGDSLRSTDLLATSQLRAAYVQVLSRTAGVAVHPGVVDSRNRPAVRADFVDPNNRPGELASLYFDPHTFQLVEESDRSTTPSPYRSQSYDVAPPAATTSPTLGLPVNTTVMTAERVVDRLPAKLSSCRVQKDN